MIQQTPRPWANQADALVVPPPAPDLIVAIIEIGARDSAGESIRYEATMHRWARRLANQDGVHWVAWSRSRVDCVIRSADPRQTASALTHGLAGASWLLWSKPEDWDLSMPSAERAARAVLGTGSHQCGHSLCLCGYQGTERPDGPADRHGERGGRYGREAHR